MYVEETAKREHLLQSAARWCFSALPQPALDPKANRRRILETLQPIDRRSVAQYGRMEYAYTYGDPDRLYLNVTNRCTNRCRFCVRHHARGLGGAILRGGPEPDLQALLTTVEGLGGPAEFAEFIWCGFGEPTFRLDLITGAASWLRSGGARIRLNTNGHACLIHGRNILPELSVAVDEVSISLNAPDCSTYLSVCQPDPDSFPVGAGCFWQTMLDFLSRAPAYFAGVQATVVGFALPHQAIENSRALACSLGVRQFRVR